MASNTFLVFSTVVGVSEHAVLPDASKYTPNTLAYDRGWHLWFIRSAIGHKIIKNQPAWLPIDVNKVPKKHRLTVIVYS